MNGLESTKHSIGKRHEQLQGSQDLAGVRVVLACTHPTSVFLSFHPKQPPFPVCWNQMSSADLCASWSCSEAWVTGWALGKAHRAVLFTLSLLVWDCRGESVLSSPHCPLSPGEERLALFPGQQNMKLSIQGEPSAAQLASEVPEYSFPALH